MQTPPSRRRFVQMSAAIATSAFPILGANDKVQLGIVGLGGRGNDHMNFYGKLDTECRMAAVCDVNQAARERAVARIQKEKGFAPKDFSDMRKMFESKEVDAVSVATPNHWHALAAIWACQAGKDVYVEKPASHNCHESRKMVEAARKYNRMVQVGSQSRSIPHKMRAIQLLQEGVIGQVYHARGLCFRRRFSIGHSPDEAVPPGLDWSLFLGPAQYKPYSKNKFAYNWHWFWDTGNGDIGNQGVHEMDIALWGLGRTAWPNSVQSSGGKYVWKDDQETPNTLHTVFDFGDAELSFDTRNLPTPPEGLANFTGSPNYVGNIFFGDQGFLAVDSQGFRVYKGTLNISGDAARGAGAGGRDRFEKTMEEKGSGEDTLPHMKNFFDAIRARDYKLLHAEIAIGARSASFCHVGNIAFRVARSLRMNTSTGRFLGDDEANSLLTRDYRAPYVVPDSV
jgi:predicted dehydrogenase